MLPLLKKLTKLTNSRFEVVVAETLWDCSSVKPGSCVQLSRQKHRAMTFTSYSNQCSAAHWKQKLYLTVVCWDHRVGVHLSDGSRAGTNIGAVPHLWLLQCVKERLEKWGGATLLFPVLGSGSQHDLFRYRILTFFAYIRPIRTASANKIAVYFPHMASFKVNAGYFWLFFSAIAHKCTV